MVTLEQLVPKAYLLWLIDRHIHFDFIREQTEHLYCADNGRPAIDPVQLFKMLFDDRAARRFEDRLDAQVWR